MSIFPEEIDFEEFLTFKIGNISISGYQEMTEAVDEDHPLIAVLSFLLILYLCLLGLVLVWTYLFIFPVYFSVFQKNRERDKTVIVYPIIRQFFGIVVSMQIAVTLFSLASIALAIINNSISSKLYKALGLIATLIFILFSLSVTTIQNILLFLLAFQRFIIVMFPKHEKQITLKRQTITRLLKGLYITIVVITITLRLQRYICYLKYYSEYEEYHSCYYIYYHWYLNFYIGTDVLVFSSCIFYIVIVIKIGVLVKMTSTLKTKSETYIWHQTYLLFFAKVVVIPPIMYLYYENTENELIYNLIIICDICSINFVIQISYLICNGNNVRSCVLFILRACLKLSCCTEPPVAPPQLAATPSRTAPSNQANAVS